jgi:prefoldin subunit 5
MTPNSQESPIQQLREEIQLLRGELDQLGKQLDRVDVRTTSHGQALDDIETYVTETAQLASHAAEQARAAAEQAAISDAEHAAGTANGTTDVKAGKGVDMAILVPWVENNITTLIARKVPTTDGAPKWCQCWWDHAEAIARLEAARQAWVALSGAGGTALVTYFDYLDRVVLAPLTSDTGPFARCGPRHHTVERPLGHTPPPPEVYPDPTPPATPNPLHPATAT